MTLSSRLEAVLFAAGEPLKKARLEKLLDTKAASLAAAAAELKGALEGRGIALIETDTELELRTAGDAADDIKTLRESELSRDLGKASLETMAMIVYRNGATRGEIDWVRGVNSGAAIRTLLMRGLIERVDDPADKRRAKYLPTVEALAHLGIGAKEELPRYAEFTASLIDHEATAAAANDE
ncbi:MAG TPA: SMC-Scp complex subunit ScpB [Candidatus Paceibacterota bacterium]|nr:SMC-Scp complex subunit ScpB [Candidatus Paceibacterota bacterium]